MASSFLDAAGPIGRVMINERIEAGRHARRVLPGSHVPCGGRSRPGRERMWALVPARAEGISIRALAAAARPFRPADPPGIRENGHSQERDAGMTPVNTASAMTQPGEPTPENAELLAG
jgi:hypothetical protein